MENKVIIEEIKCLTGLTDESIDSVLDKLNKGEKVSLSKKTDKQLLLDRGYEIHI